MSISLGLQAVVEHEVEEADTALSMKSGDIRVLATPRLLALCEEATVEALRAEMREEVTTVGTRIEFEHVSPSSVGQRVSARAQLIHLDGRTLKFEVVAHDATGQLIGRGEISRMLVDRQQFRARLSDQETVPDALREALAEVVTETPPESG